MIIVNFENNEEYKKAYGLWQYDYGQVLRIQGLDLPTAVEMHFSLTETGGEAVTRIGITKDGVTDVTIPDSLLEADEASQDYQIYVFIYLATPDSGETTRRITLGVKSRPRPEVFDTPGEEELFEGAVQAVNDAAKRAEEAGKEATAAAGEARESASQAGKHLADTQALAEQVEINADTVAQGAEKAKELLAQTQEVASNAVISAQAAKQAEMAAREAQTAAESAEDAARQYAAGTEADRQEVAEKKQSVTQMQSNVARMQADVQADREAVEQTVSEFGQTTQDALTALGQAQNTAVSAVTEEGQRQATTVQETGAQAVSEVDTAKTAAVGAVTAEGDKQVGRVQEAAAEIVADREQIQQNKTDIATLTDKTNTLAPGIVLDARGKQIIISDASEQPFVGLKVYGKSEQFTTDGAQLLNPALYDKDKTVNGVTFTKQADGSVILTGKSTGTSTFYLGEYVDVLEDGKTYIYGSGSPLGVINITYNDGTSNGYLNVITVDKSRMVSIKPYIQFSIEKPAPNNMRILPMFNEGTVIKPWEPYSGGKPSPNPEYPQKIVSAGEGGEINVHIITRNLFPIDKLEKYEVDNSAKKVSLDGNKVIFTGRGNTGKESVAFFLNKEEDKLRLAPGKYILSFKSDQPHGAVNGERTVEMFLLVEKQSGTVNTYSTGSAGMKSINIEAGDRLYFRFDINNDSMSAEFYDIMFVQNSTALPYEPHARQSLTLTTPNGIAGIPTKGNGNYTDENGQQWICDTIECRDGIAEYVQRIGEIVVNSDAHIAADLADYGALQENTVIGRYFNESIKRETAILCKELQIIENWSNDKESAGTVEKGIDFRLSRERIGLGAETTNEQNKTAILKFLETTPLHFVVQLDTPIRTPLTQEEMAAYKALHTYSPNTTVVNDAGCGMSLTYIADTKKYVDKKIAAISAAMIGG